MTNGRSKGELTPRAAHAIHVAWNAFYNADPARGYRVAQRLGREIVPTIVERLGADGLAGWCGRAETVGAPLAGAELAEPLAELLGPEAAAEATANAEDAENSRDEAGDGS